MPPNRCSVKCIRSPLGYLSSTPVRQAISPDSIRRSSRLDPLAEREERRTRNCLAFLSDRRVGSDRHHLGLNRVDSVQAEICISA
jgi:hypothetical protein